MGIIDTILWPIRWVIEAMLVGFHRFFEYIGFEGGSGLSWVLSITVLVLVVRSALIPVFVRQIKSQRKMIEISPDLKKIQDKYKGKKDQFSREAMSRETMALYSKAGTNPFSSCLPLLLQMPIFFALFRVLSEAGQGNAGVSFMTKDFAVQFGTAELFGMAPLSATMQTALNGEAGLESAKAIAVAVIAGVMVVLMSGSQFVTQLQIMSKNQSRDEGIADVSPAAHFALHAAVGVLVLWCVLPTRCDVLLARLKLLDHGPAVPCYPQHANPG